MTTISRRGFLKGAGASAGALAITSIAPLSRSEERRVGKEC